MKKYLFLILIIAGSYLPVSFSYSQAVGTSWSEKMAATAMTIWKDSLVVQPGNAATWNADEGLVLEGFTNLWRRTAKGEYFKFMQTSMNRFVQNDGRIALYNPEEYNLKYVKNGRILLTLNKVTLQEKYYKAATLLREQLTSQPRTKEGSFWHQKLYPYQTWLEDLYLVQPFYVEYATTFNQPEALTDVANQFITMEQHVRDTKTGLFHNGWDESRKQAQVDKSNGLSTDFWGRGMGWYGMGLVDALENFPKNHPKRAALLQILARFAAAIEQVQDPQLGVWYQNLNKPAAPGNFPEASASNMFVYTLAKGVRLKFLPSKYEAVAQKGYEGIIKEFVKTDEAGQVNLHGTVKTADSGGSPYRDESLDYLRSEKRVVNDPKGVGTFLLAANEMELRALPAVGKGKTILLDGYFNNEFMKDASGQTIPFHYKWEEQGNNGFSLLGEHARYRGAQTLELKQAPTSENLKKASVYIIVDPDTEKETAKPNYVEPGHVKVISDWVKNGGVLLLMGNDLPNAELDRFNTLAKAFGIEFKKETKNRVTGNQFEMGKIIVPVNHSIFKTGRQLFLKEISTLTLKAPAKSVLEHKGDVVMAIAKVGKGTVFAVGDPWLYNEYTDGRRLPAEYQNLEAGTDLLNWLLTQVPAPTKN